MPNSLHSYVSDSYLEERLFGKVEDVLGKTNLVGRIVPVGELKGVSEVEAAACGFACRIIEFAKDFLKVSEAIRFCLVDADGVENAMATLLPTGEYVVILFTGMNLQILTFSRLICHCEPVISALELDKPENVIGFDNYKDINTVNGLPDIKFIGLEHTETSIALYLAMTGGIIFHELSHVIDGHLAFQRQANLGLLGELQTVWADKEEQRFTQETLEYDADAFSAQSLLHMISFGKALPQIFKPFMEPGMRQKFVLIALGATFLYDDVYNVTDLSWSETSLSNHAPAQVRLNTVFVTILLVMTDKYRLSEDEVSDILGDSLRAITYCSFLLRKSNHDPSLKDKVPDLFNAFLKYNARVHGRWAKILPALEKLKLSVGPKLAPAQAPPI